MKLRLFLLFALLTSISYGQNFSFTMHFIDAIGNTDSLIMGSDPQGTDTIDPQFNEINILNAPYHSGLDIRAGNQWFLENFGFTDLPFETKKQIVHESCNGFAGLNEIIEINVVTDNFPVNITWNRPLFHDPCKNGSVFTAVHPGGWWDTGGIVYGLSAAGSGYFDRSQYYFMHESDTVFVYWLAFGDSTMLSTGVFSPSPTASDYIVFPNPSSGIFQIEENVSAKPISSIQLYNYSGDLILQSSPSDKIDLSDLPKGLYFLAILNGSGIPQRQLLVLQ